MGLAWHATHIQFASPKTIASVARETMENATGGKIVLANDEPLLSYDLCALGATLVCISPQEGGWTGLWGASSRFAALTMQRGQFSGMVIEREDHDDAPWHYQIWNTGVIADWFVSSPKDFFDPWAPEMIDAAVRPYLLSRGVDSTNLNYHQTMELIKQRLDAFGGDLELLTPFVRAELQEPEIRTWQRSQATPAFERIPDILAIPFAGTDYDSIAMGVHFDIRRGVASLEKVDDRTKALYKWSTERIRRIGEFTPLAFKLVEGLKRSVILEELWHVFYWG